MFRGWVIGYQLCLVIFGIVVVGVGYVVFDYVEGIVIIVWVGFIFWCFIYGYDFGFRIGFQFYVFVFNKVNGNYVFFDDVVDSCQNRWDVFFFYLRVIMWIKYSFEFFNYK